MLGLLALVKAVAHSCKEAIALPPRHACVYTAAEFTMPAFAQNEYLLFYALATHQPATDAISASSLLITSSTNQQIKSLQAHMTPVTLYLSLLLNRRHILPEASKHA